MVVNQKCRMTDQLKKLYGVSTNFSAILFGKDVEVLARYKFSQEEPLTTPIISNATLYCTDSIFWKTMPWKVRQKLHPHNQGEVLWTIYKYSII